MNKFNLNQILSNVNKKTISFGEEYFKLNKIDHFDYNMIADEVTIDAICNGYKNHIEFNSTSNLNKHYCECFIGHHSVICKHIVCTVIYFLEKIIVATNDALDRLSSKQNVELRDLQLRDLFLDLDSNENIFDVFLNDNNISISKANFLLKYSLDDFTKLNQWLENNSNDYLKKIQNKNNLILAINGLFRANEQKVLLFDEEVDLLISQIKTKDYFKFSCKNKSNLITKFYFADAKPVIKLKTHDTSIGSIALTNINLISCIPSINHTYLFYELDNDFYIYEVDYIEPDEITSNIFSEYRNRNIKSFYKKIEKLKQLPIFNVVERNEDFNHIEKHAYQIDLEFIAKTKQVKITIYAPDINQMLNMHKLPILKNFVENSNRIENADNFVYYLVNMKLLYEILDELEELRNNKNFLINIPNYFAKNYELKTIDIDFDIKNDSIELILDNKEKNDKDFINSLLSTYKKYGDHLFEYKNEIINTKHYNIKDLFDKFQQMDINLDEIIKHKEYTLDIAKVFYLAKSFHSKTLLEYVDYFEKQEMQLDVDQYLLDLLKPYQLFGVKWIKKMLTFSNGCILADEMGLGKTVQAIAYMNDLSKTNPKPMLIICPSSLVTNWLREFTKFDSNQTIIEIDDNVKNRIANIKNISENKIYITTYHKIINDIEYYKNTIFSLIVLDESQYIKNRNSKWTKHVKQLQSESRLVLSGTPIENNIFELWSLFDFIIPGYLGRYDSFKRRFNNKPNDASLNELSLLIKPFIIQRKKSDELPSLPNKEYNNILIKMNSFEVEHYNTLFKNIKNEVTDYLKSTKKKDNYNKINILALISKLRQFCCDPQLLFVEMENRSKIEKCLQLVNSLKDNQHNKIVIFSSFTSLLFNLKDVLQNYGYEVLIMTGENTRVERTVIIDTFNSCNNKILLASLKTGGVGINLNTANVVIHFNPWWNDSVENQAIDRLHRIGQKRIVNIYNLILADSIEEDIIKIKEKKRQIIDNTINNSSNYDELLKLINDKNI